MKKQMRKLTIMIAFIFTMSSLLTGCTTFNNFKEGFFAPEEGPEEVIKIGVFEPLSGENEAHGKLELQGIQLANELFPEVLGKKVELVYGDNKSDLDVAETAAKELVGKGVSVVLGSYGSTLSLIGGSYFEEAKIPAIAISSRNPLVTNSNEYYFRVCFVESFQGIALAKYAVEVMGTSKAAIIKDVDDDYTAAMSQAFSEKYISLTGDENAIAYTAEFKADKMDFKEELMGIKESGAEVVFLSSKEEVSAAILGQAKELGLQATFMGTNRWETEKFLEVGGNQIEGAVFSAFFDADSNITENTEVFLKAYREKYGQDAVPDSSVALGFDAYLVAINAIANGGTRLDGPSIREALLLTRDFPGAAGRISFDQNGDPIKSVAIKTITNGKFVHTYTVEPTWQ